MALSNAAFAPDTASRGGGFASTLAGRLEQMLLRIGGARVADAGDLERLAAMRLFVEGRLAKSIVRVDTDALTLPKRSTRAYLAYGFALAADGTWERHVWCVHNETIYDDVPREKYFGAHMPRADAGRYLRGLAKRDLRLTHAN